MVNSALLRGVRQLYLLFGVERRTMPVAILLISGKSAKQRIPMSSCKFGMPIQLLPVAQMLSATQHIIDASSCMHL